MSTIFLGSGTPDSIHSRRAKMACTKLKSAQSNKVDIAKKGAFFCYHSSFYNISGRYPSKIFHEKTRVLRNLLVFLSGKR